MLKVYVDGDLRVAVGGTTWTFNPLVCTLMPHTQQEMNNTLGTQHTRDDHQTSECCQVFVLSLTLILQGCHFSRIPVFPYIYMASV